MTIVNTLAALDFGSSEALRKYWDSPLLRRLYVLPKRVSDVQISCCLSDDRFMAALETAAAFCRRQPLETLCRDVLHCFESDTGFALPGGQLYLILGCGTSTVYSLPGGESVLCLEALAGDADRLKLLLAHEYVHWIRRQSVCEDLFASCTGERLVAEGLAENYSREMLPGLPDSAYCLVPEDTVRWVRTEGAALFSLIQTHLEDDSRLDSLFQKNEQTVYPHRTGYVYGYDIVRRYLEEKNFRLRDILTADWRRILYTDRSTP